MERAEEELRSLLAWQHGDGFIPDVIFWDRRRARPRDATVGETPVEA